MYIEYGIVNTFKTEYLIYYDQVKVGVSFGKFYKLYPPSVKVEVQAIVVTPSAKL